MAPGGGEALPHEAKQSPVHLALHHFLLAELLRLLRGHRRGGAGMLDKIRQLVGIEAPPGPLLDADHPIAPGQHIRVVAHQEPGRPWLEGEPCSSTWAATMGSRRRQRVVQQQDIGPGVGGAGQGDPLLLAAGEAGAELPTRV